MEPLNPWRLEARDAFSGEYYPLPGEFATEAEAIAAARVRMEELEAQSASPELRDGVFVIPPCSGRSDQPQ